MLHWELIFNFIFNFYSRTSKVTACIWQKFSTEALSKLDMRRKKRSITPYISFLSFIDAMVSIKVAMHIGLMPFSRSLRYDFPRGDPKKASIATTGRANDSANVQD